MEPVNPDLLREQWTNLGTQLVKTVMASASTKKIRPIDWWARARSALETACAAAETFSALVTKMADKLQIEAFQEHSSNWISSVHHLFVRTEDFEPARDFWAANAVYICALAQAERAAEKEG